MAGKNFIGLYSYSKAELKFLFGSIIIKRGWMMNWELCFEEFFYNFRELVHSNNENKIWPVKIFLAGIEHHFEIIDWEWSEKYFEFACDFVKQSNIFLQEIENEKLSQEEIELVEILTDLKRLGEVLICQEEEGGWENGFN
ncbi:MAG: hypothetical protein ACOCUF_03990 [Patescibacteria group bacterium]